MSSDSILGVAMDFYAIHGLKATIEFEEPDTADSSVYLYSRCADYTASGDYLGSLVAEGVEKQSDRSRLGYMAMADGNMVIGVSRSEKVKDYVLERGGSFFRQFIFVSNGTIPSRFFLHGKSCHRSHRRPALLYRHPPQGNSLGLCRCTKRIWLYRCHLHHWRCRLCFLS